MKHLIYSCIAVCALLFTSCADQDVTENVNSNDGKPGITVSMSMEGNMQGNQAAPTSRAGGNSAIGYETDDNTGFPTPIGIYNKGTNEGTELANGDKVPVLLVFKSTDTTQPVTKVITNWTYKQGGELTLEPSETFEMKAGTDLSKGKWFVCGILGGEPLPGANQVKFNGFIEGHVARNVAGNKVKWGANIPYVFSWRELETNQANKTIKAKDPVRFKQFGTIVRLKVTNKTGFGFKYNGVRIITSNILCGQFDLKVFDEVPTTDLTDTKDATIASATLSSFQDAFKAFKFYQRPLTDNAMIGSDGLIAKKHFSIKGVYIANYAEEKANDAKADNDLSKKFNTALTYIDHTFLKDATGNNFDNVPDNSEAPSYIYVWMAPQTQAVKLYNDNMESATSTNYTVNHVAKTQFLLMAVPTETSSATKNVPSSINMIPAYGSLKPYTSGANYPARGSVV